MSGRPYREAKYSAAIDAYTEAIALCPRWILPIINRWVLRSLLPRSSPPHSRRSLTLTPYSSNSHHSLAPSLPRSPPFTASHLLAPHAPLTPQSYSPVSSLINSQREVKSKRSGAFSEVVSPLSSESLHATTSHPHASDDAISLVPTPLSALCYRKKKSWAGVKSDCEKALDIDRQSIKANYMLGLSLIFEKQHSEVRPNPTFAAPATHNPARAWASFAAPVTPNSARAWS